MENKTEGFKRKEHIPFTRYPIRCKQMDGIYKSKDGKHIHIVKNVNLVGLIDSETEKDYCSYRVSIKSTNPDIGYLKSCLIDDLENWEKVLDL